MPPDKQAVFTPEEEAEQLKAEEEANAQAKAETEAGEGEAEAKETEGEQPSGSESAPEGPKAPSKETETKPKGEGEESEEEFTHLSEKAQKRFRALSAKAKRAEGLEKRVLDLEREKSKKSPLFEPQETEEPKDEGEQDSEGLPWDNPDQPREVSEEEFSHEVDKKAAEKAKKLVSDALAKYDRANNTYRQLQVDLDLVESEVDELNPGKRDLVTNEIIEPNPNYNQNFAIKVRDYYKALVKENPNLRLITFVRELMDLRKQGAEAKAKEITSEVAKQAAYQALTPSGASGPSGNQELTSLLEKAETMEDLDEAEKLLPHADR